MSSEYVLIFFVVMGVMSAMFIYFQRTLQARIRDARNAMVKSVGREVAGGKDIQKEYDAEFIEYEPYYANTESIISHDRDEGTRMHGVKWGEYYKKEYFETTNIETKSRTSAPAEVR